MSTDTTTTTTTARPPRLRRLLGAAAVLTATAGAAVGVATVSGDAAVEDAMVVAASEGEVRLVEDAPLPERVEVLQVALATQVDTRLAEHREARAEALDAAFVERTNERFEAQQAAERAARDAAFVALVDDRYAAQQDAVRAANRGALWDRVAECESNQRWSYNGSSGFDGGLQFHPGTWSAYKPADYPAYAYQATREQQILVAEDVLASQGWRAWPACSKKLGLR